MKLHGHNPTYFKYSMVKRTDIISGGTSYFIMDTKLWYHLFILIQYACGICSRNICR